MGQTVAEKIARSRMVAGPTDRPLRAGDFLTVRPDHVMTHDNTAAVMNKFRAIGVPKVRHRSQPVYILDHDIQNRTEANLAKYRAIEEFAGEMRRCPCPRYWLRPAKRGPTDYRLSAAAAPAVAA